MRNWSSMLGWYASVVPILLVMTAEEMRQAHVMATAAAWIGGERQRRTRQDFLAILSGGAAIAEPWYFAGSYAWSLSCHSCRCSWSHLLRTIYDELPYSDLPVLEPLEWAEPCSVVVATDGGKESFYAGSHVLYRWCRFMSGTTRKWYSMRAATVNTLWVVTWCARFGIAWTRM